MLFSKEVIVGLLFFDPHSKSSEVRWASIHHWPQYLISEFRVPGASAQTNTDIRVVLGNYRRVMKPELQQAGIPSVARQSGISANAGCADRLYS
jgi:hypothetical protein